MKRRLVSGDTEDWPRYAMGIVPPNFEGDIGRVPMLAGESYGVVNDIKPAGLIVRDLVREAEAALAAAEPRA